MVKDRYSTYAGAVPDEDVETCLKVIRTLRDRWCFAAGESPPRCTDPDNAILLSDAHAYMVRSIERDDAAKIGG